MNGSLNVLISELVYGLSLALDLVSPALVNHHRQVFGFAIKIAAALNLSDQEKSDIAIAAMLHDIGVVAFNRGINLNFDDASQNDHAELGARLMQEFKPFAAAAELVRHHHSRWDGYRDSAASHNRALIGSNIIYLADRVAVRLDSEHCVLEQAAAVRTWAQGESGGMFMPEVVAAFMEVSEREYFWLDSLFASMPRLGITTPLAAWNVALDMDGLRDLSDLFRRIIDYRSRHTASHSRSVAHIAEALARLIGFSGNGCSLIHVAGNLHDLGKLALPAAILDKPTPLTSLERNLVKSHAYHTYRILQEISGLGEISSWAAFHHECPDGSGYPFRLCGDEIPLGARIVAVADTFVALTESRPYRDGMSQIDCLQTMQAMTAEQKLDPLLVSLVAGNYDDLFALQMSVQRDGLHEYEKILHDSLTFLSAAGRAAMPLELAA